MPERVGHDVFVPLPQTDKQERHPRPTNKHVTPDLFGGLDNDKLWKLKAQDN